MRDNWFAKIPAWVLFDKELNRKEKIIYTALALFADSQGRCYPSVQLLADISSYSKACVFEALKSLEEKGVIIRKQRFSDGSKISTLYSLAKTRYEAPPLVQKLDDPRLKTGRPSSENWTTPVQKLDIEQSQLTEPDNRARGTAPPDEILEGVEKNRDQRQGGLQDDDDMDDRNFWKKLSKRRSS